MRVFAMFLMVLSLGMFSLVGCKPAEVTPDPEPPVSGEEDPGAEDPGAEDPGAEDPGAEDPGPEDPGAEDPTD